MIIEDIKKEMEAAWAAFRRHSLEADRQNAIADGYLETYNKLETLLNKYEDDTVFPVDRAATGPTVLNRN